VSPQAQMNRLPGCVRLKGRFHQRPPVAVPAAGKVSIDAPDDSTQPLAISPVAFLALAATCSKRRQKQRRRNSCARSLDPNARRYYAR
jgi:hypothetical protein